MRILALVVSLMVASTVQAEPVKLLTFNDILVMSRGLTKPHIAYGPDVLQFGELWLPKSGGAHPVIVMIHGGCWRADLPGLELQASLSQALAARGWAVWNLEYRRIGHAGGAYPGTFVDIALGVDALRGLAKANHLDLNRVVIMGHSAGGHLSTWAGARGKLPATSPLWKRHSLLPKAVVTLAGINDLEAYHDKGPDACGGPSVVENLVDFKGRGLAAYADTSPVHFLPLGIGQIVVSGELDPIVPPSFGEAYSSKAMKSGDPVQPMTIHDAGHFELIDPNSKAWATLFPLIDALGGLTPKP